MDMRQSGEMEVVLGKVTVQQGLLGVFEKGLRRDRCGTVNQDPSKIRPFKELRRQGVANVVAFPPPK